MTSEGLGEMFEGEGEGDENNLFLFLSSDGTYISMTTS
jgi:hypothetical protein